MVFLLHACLRPFADRHYGRVEAGFLCDLVLIAAIRIRASVYTYLGQVDGGITEDALGYIEAGLVLLPLCYCILVLLVRQGPPLFRRIGVLLPNRWRHPFEGHVGDSELSYGRLIASTPKEEGSDEDVREDGGGAEDSLTVLQKGVNQSLD